MRHGRPWSARDYPCPLRHLGREIQRDQLATSRSYRPHAVVLGPGLRDGIDVETSPRPNRRRFWDRQGRLPREGLCWERPRSGQALRLRVRARLYGEFSSVQVRTRRDTRGPGIPARGSGRRNVHGKPQSIRPSLGGAMAVHRLRSAKLLFCETIWGRVKGRFPSSSTTRKPTCLHASGRSPC